MDALGVGVGEAQPEVERLLGERVERQELSQAIYGSRELQAKCPLISRTRIIPRAVLPELAAELRRRRERSTRTARTNPDKGRGPDAA